MNFVAEIHSNILYLKSYNYFRIKAWVTGVDFYSEEKKAVSQLVGNNIQSHKETRISEMPP